MKFSYFLFCSFFFLAFQTTKPIKSNKPPKGYAFIPAGLVDIEGEKQAISTFLMPETEVTNGQYRTFLDDLKMQGKDSIYLLAYPDTSAWIIAEWKSMESMANMYFWHPAYANYPVVNVSKSGPIYIVNG